MYRTVSFFVAMLLLLIVFTSCNSFTSSLPEDTNSTDMETQLTMDSTVPTSKTTEFIYPDDTPHIVRKNAEILFQEMDTIKEAALFSARKLESVGIKEIKDIHIEIVRGGFYHATIVDSDGEQYYISLGEYGYIGGIRKDDIDGEIVWLPIF